MPTMYVPWRHRVASRVLDMMKAAALKVGIAEHSADRFVLRSLLMSSRKQDITVRHKSQTRRQGKVVHRPHRAARRRTKAARLEQRRKGIYRRAQS
jgi:hypothetical protein